MTRRVLAILIALACFPFVFAPAGCSVATDDEADGGRMHVADFSSLSVTDIHGRRQPVWGGDTRGVLLIFTSHQCPIANAYAPRIQRIYEDFAPRGIGCYLVEVDPGVSDEQLRDHFAQYALTMPIIHDTTHALVKRTAARVTPQAVLLDPQGRIVYSGRVDDEYVDFGVKRRQPTSHDLADALESFLAGMPVTRRTTTAVGCYIEDLSPAKSSR